MSEPKLQGKTQDIPKHLVWDAWLKVKRNGGAAGADGVTIEQFEERLKDRLYKLWNRMSSGSYFPGPVRAVEIPKKGGTRVLGIPNVVDRVAQTVAVLVLEPSVERVFHDDSYAYRPGRSPLDAVGTCRERCWKKDWIVDLDVKAFFDSVPWDLMLRALERHTDQKWVRLYVARWLQAPMLMTDGTMVARVKGDPARGSDLPVDRQHLPAPRLRRLDDPRISGCPVREVRRRCGDPLRDRAPGPRSAGGGRSSVRRYRVGTSSRQDEDRVLQRRQTSPGL